MPKLPSETSDIIIDHLHDDVSTLRQCSLVCKEWLPASRFHIFSVVHLSLYSIDQMLDAVFYPGSPMPQYIRDLYITDGQGRDFDPKWVSEKLPLVPLSSMSCISTLSLEQVDFSEVSGAAMTALCEITARVSRLELTYVRFEDVSGCLDFLKAAVSVRSLASWVTSLADETRSRHSENSTFLPKLVELELESDDDPLLDLLCSTSFPPRIRALSLCFGAGNISAVANLLGCLGSSLSHLQLQSFCFDTMPPDMNARDTDLSRNPNLKCIIFRRNSSHWITNILDTAAAAVPLERVYMVLWNYDELLRLRSIFTAEAGALRRTEIVLFNIDIGTRSAITEWMEDMNLTEPGRVQARDRGVTLRDLRSEYMYD